MADTLPPMDDPLCAAAADDAAPAASRQDAPAKKTTPSNVDARTVYFQSLVYQDYVEACRDHGAGNINVLEDAYRRWASRNAGPISDGRAYTLANMTMLGKNESEIRANVTRESSRQTRDAVAQSGAGFCNNIVAIFDEDAFRGPAPRQGARPLVAIAGPLPSLPEAERADAVVYLQYLGHTATTGVCGVRAPDTTKVLYEALLRWRTAHDDAVDRGLKALRRHRPGWVKEQIALQADMAGNVEVRLSQRYDNDFNRACKAETRAILAAATDGKTPPPCAGRD